MFKNFVESIAANLTKRVDDLVTKIADLKASLEFSQNDIENHKTQITLLDTNLQSAVEEITKLQTLGAKQLEKATYLENQSRRNNVRIEGIVEEWEAANGLTSCNRACTLNQKSQETRWYAKTENSRM